VAVDTALPHGPQGALLPCTARKGARWQPSARRACGKRRGIRQLGAPLEPRHLHRRRALEPAARHERGDPGGWPAGPAGGSAPSLTGTSTDQRPWEAGALPQSSPAAGPGEAYVRLRQGIIGASRGGPGPFVSYWVVEAVPASESFKAKLNGTVEVVSGQTHLVDRIIEGAGKGRRVETSSRLLNFGPNQSLSDIDGNSQFGTSKRCPRASSRSHVRRPPDQGLLLG
jgi:hypothetical protein